MAEEGSGMEVGRTVKRPRRSAEPDWPSKTRNSDSVDRVPSMVV